MEEDDAQINEIAQRLESEADSVSHSYRSFNDNVEEGKSLLDDFNIRHRNNPLFPPIRDFEGPNNFQGEEIPEDLNEDANIPSEPNFPAIHTEESKESSSNGFKKFQTHRMNCQESPENISKVSMFQSKEEVKSLGNRSLDLNSYINSIKKVNPN